MNIGGYFELEIRAEKEYHSALYSLNTGRCALELILLLKNYSKVYIPYYTCISLLEPFEKLNIQYEFYYINDDFEPIFNYSIIKNNEGFLYTNYFGLKDKFIRKLTCKNLIIDNTQSFFSTPNNIDTFYSARKFFGVPDGAYVFINGNITIPNFPISLSYNNFSHLLKRFELSPNDGYDDFKLTEKSLNNNQIKQMSKLTKAILSSIDYNKVIEKRRHNFSLIHNHLMTINELYFDLDADFVPMIYPFLCNMKNLKKTLIKNNIFVPTYWDNVLDWASVDSLEYKFTTNIIFIPIDQRYDENDMMKIINIIEKNI